MNCRQSSRRFYLQWKSIWLKKIRTRKKISLWKSVLAPEEMKQNGAEVIHLATGLAVGYPPCPHLDAFLDFIPAKFGLEVVVGTHPIPEKYHRTHRDLGTWHSVAWQERIEPILTNEEMRRAYD